MRKVICTLLIALTALSCRSFATSTKHGTQGSPYEVLVVCNNAEWESPLGEALRTLLQQPVEMLSSAEPMFSVLRVTPNNFNGAPLLEDHRNILKVVLSPKAEQAAILAQYDVTAAPQVVLTFQSPDEASALEYLSQNGGALLDVLELAERDRTIAYGKQYQNRLICDAIRSVVGVEMRVPKGYELRSESDHFVWASREFPTASQGFFIYSYPYTGKDDLSLENLVRMRNAMASRIPGPSDGSYMVTVDKIPIDSKHYKPFEPSYKVLKINGQTWIEMRGFWDVANDFMGGPFVSFTTVDKASQRVVTLDCYVHSPKYGKRNHLRALEHLVYLIDLGDKEQ